MSRVAAIFDVDGTLVRANVVDYYLFFIKHCFQPLQKTARIVFMALRIPYWWTLDHLDRSWFNRSFYRNYRAIPPEEISRLAKLCFEKFISKRLIPETVERLRQHQQRGDEIILLSGSLDFIVSPLALQLDVQATLAPTLALENGRFTGRLTAPPLIGEQKAHVLREYAARYDLDLTQSYAYADSKSDLPLLESVGHPIVVNPKGKMKRIAQKKGWEILSKTSSPFTAALPDLLSNSSKPKLQNLGGLR